MFNNLGLRFLKIGAAVTVVFWVYVLPENILIRKVRKMLHLKQETLSSIWAVFVQRNEVGEYSLEWPHSLRHSLRGTLLHNQAHQFLPEVLH